MSEAELAFIEYRWTAGYLDCEDLKSVFAEVRRLREELQQMRILARQSEERANAEWARNIYRPILEAREAGRGGSE